VLIETSASILSGRARCRFPAKTIRIRPVESHTIKRSKGPCVYYIFRPSYLFIFWKKKETKNRVKVPSDYMHCETNRSIWRLLLIIQIV
jgi:hypothetical protein